MNRLFRPMRLGALLPLVGDLRQHLSARLDLQRLGDRRVMPLRERHSLPPLGWHQPGQAVGICELVRFGPGLVRADLGTGAPLPLFVQVNRSFYETFTGAVFYERTSVVQRKMG